MNPNEASANKTQNITTLGETMIPVPANPVGKLVLVRLIINTKGASSNKAKIYDTAEQNSNENIKGSIDTTITVGAIECGYPFFNGIRIVSETGTPADITVVYAEIA